MASPWDVGTVLKGPRKLPRDECGSREGGGLMLQGREPQVCDQRGHSPRGTEQVLGEAGRGDVFQTLLFRWEE